MSDDMPVISGVYFNVVFLGLRAYAIYKRKD
jgi:hypothetical protein